MIAPNTPEPWILISLKPSGGHAPLRRCAARHGGRLLALSPWRLQRDVSPTARKSLTVALAAPAVVFTSPAAAHAAHALIPLHRPHHACWISVGEGTARALRTLGVDKVMRPGRMDSEGVLALPMLSHALPAAVGLVTAPGGRGLLQATLEQRGTRVIRADVYTRVPLRLSVARQQAMTRALPHSVLVLSSGEALRLVLAQLPTALIGAWRQRPVVATSPRLLDIARQAGFHDVHAARGPLPTQLCEAAAAIMTASRHN